MPFVFSILLTASFAPQVLTVDLTTVSTVDAKEVWIEKLHECENYEDIPWIVDTNGKKSYGYVMFQMGTWLKYKAQGATRENIGDDKMQKKIARYILDTKGYGDWQTCGRLVVKRLGSYPSE